MNVITGTGRCGTSMTARVLLASGYDPHSHDYIEEPMWAGHERRDMADINNMMIRQMGERGLVFPDEQFTADMVEEHGDRLRAMTQDLHDRSWPKDPRIMRLFPIWHEVVGLEAVILCVRHIPHAWRSAELARTRVHEASMDTSAAALGYGLAWLEHEAIPYTIMPYPDVTTNRDLFVERLSAVLEVDEWILRGYDEIVDPGLVHVRSES